MAEPIREIETDVLVVGGGTAGFAAALAAARSGLRVRLIEAAPKIGGVMASCPDVPWGGGCCDLAPKLGTHIVIFSVS